MSMHGIVFVLAGVLLRGSTLLAAEPLDYPKTRKGDQSDVYHGVKVDDPYRWLEDDNSPETTAWVTAQNSVTAAYFRNIPFRSSIRDRLSELYNYPKYGHPQRRGDSYFYGYNEGLQNQFVIQVQKGLEGQPEVLLDPNKQWPDGTTALVSLEISRDGKHLAFGVSEGGSDWQVIRVMEVASKKLLKDELRWVKFGRIAWRGSGFFYSCFPAPVEGAALTSRNENQKVYFHRLGDPQSSDKLAFEDSSHPKRFCEAITTEDEGALVLSVSDEASGKHGNSISYRDLSSQDGTFIPVIPEITDAIYHFVGSEGSRLLFRTNDGAPGWKLVAFDTARRTGQWSVLIAERPEPLMDATLAGRRIFASFFKDVSTKVEVYSTSGRKLSEIGLPGPGTAHGFRGRADDTSVFYGFTSFNFPTTIFRYEIGARKSTVFRQPKIAGFLPSDYETRQVFATSKDGTRVPMFLVHKRGVKLDGGNPALLYGYGGFNIAMPPYFDPLRLALLERGFIYVSANIRGGNEYGESWHTAGSRMKKQNVFDDFLACAEWVIANRYTSPERLAIEGGSNGGLLVGAVMNQRPELFRAAVPHVGVMDMLRYQKFTIGAGWISEYGSSEDAEQFKTLYAYSPLHNIQTGVRYPATLITTADHDDRVVPAHSFKYAATLQEKASKERPALIRIETKSGHGASNTQKQLDLTADVYAFLMWELGLR